MAETGIGMKRHLLLRCLAALLVAAPSPAQPPGEPDISSFAFVQDDGSLRVAGQQVRLYGIYIPPSGQSCRSFERPLRCGSRAALALEFRISGDFIRCRILSTNPDGSVNAVCHSGDEDLAAWLLQRGWALALPDAPFAYTAMERIARARGVGIWGIPLDNFQQH